MKPERGAADQRQLVAAEHQKAQASIVATWRACAACGDRFPPLRAYHVVCLNCMHLAAPVMPAIIDMMGVGR